jgi:hypothetical protein
MATLRDAEVETYHREGLVVPAFALDRETVARMTAALEDLLARNPDTDRNVMICPHLPGYGPQAMASGDPIWLEIARCPDILDMVGRIMGPDIILWGTTVFGKPAGTGQVIPWHQDAPHWPIQPKATTSVWIALDRCTPDNGCLRYIPGSHGGEARHIDINQTPEGKGAAVRLILDPDGLDEENARDVLLEPGEMAILDTWLVHGSNPNHSPNRRAAFVLRFMPASSYFDHVNGDEAARRAGAVTDYNNRPLYLMRGENTGGSDLGAGHG